MKNTIKTLGLAGLIAVAGCSQNKTEPILEQYKKSDIEMEVPKMGLLVFTDVDKDGLVDTIRKFGSGIKIYVAKGYEEQGPGRYFKGKTVVMDEEFRERISQPFRGLQNTGYLMADKRYKPSSELK